MLEVMTSKRRHFQPLQQQLQRQLQQLLLLVLLQCLSVSAFKDSLSPSPYLSPSSSHLSPFSLINQRTPSSYRLYSSLSPSSSSPSPSYLSRSLSSSLPSSSSLSSSSSPSNLTDLLMPSLSQSEGSSSHRSNGFISVWHAKEGEKVAKGDCLFVVESDKADVDVDASHDGILRKILVPAGVRVAAGSVVGVFESLKEGDSGKETKGDSQKETKGDSGKETKGDKGDTSSQLSLPKGTVALLMPALSSTMTQGTITKWHKQEGDSINVGERILVVESDKADMEVEAFDKGYLAAITANVGDTTAVGETIGYITPRKEDVMDVKRYVETQAAAAGGGGGGAAAAAAAEQQQQQQQQETATFDHNSASRESGGEMLNANEIEEAVQAAAADYIVPSVDQSSDKQLLSGVTNEQLQLLLRHRLATAAPAAAEALKDPKLSAALAQRMALRLPPRVALLNRPFACLSGGGEDSSKDKEENNKQVFLTPAAEALAAKHNVAVKSLRGSGYGGRVTLADVKRHLGLPADTVKTQFSLSPSSDNTPATSPTNVPLTNLERTIAKNMEATLTVPVFSITRSVRVDSLMDLMLQIKSKEWKETVSPSKGDTLETPALSVLLAKAAALTLKRHPLLNARFNSIKQQIEYSESISIGMAVSIDGGLVTPVLRDAFNRDIYSLSSSWRQQVEAAKRLDLASCDMRPVSFYISNLGGRDVDLFTAVLPPNAACIMAVGSVRSTFPPHPSNHLPSKYIYFTLTCDHRHIYGMHAANFLHVGPPRICP